MTKSKRGLGRGLDALIPQNIDTSLKDTSEKIDKIDINKVIPNQNQPRKDFDPEALRELEISIQQHGLIQPIVVCEIEDGYEIIAGERRWRACKNIGMKNISAVVRSATDQQKAQLALVENLQREDLSPIEEAQAYQALIETFGATQSQVAQYVGHSRTYITNTIRLLQLDPKIQELISQKKITSGHGRAILSMDDEKKRIELANLIIEKEMTVRQAEAWATQKKKESQTNEKSKDLNSKKYEFSKVASIIQSVLGTKVHIRNGKKKGKIEIEYYGEEDLQRLLDFFKK